MSLLRQSYYMLAEVCCLKPAKYIYIWYLTEDTFTTLPKPYIYVLNLFLLQGQCIFDRINTILYFSLCDNPTVD